MTVKLKACRGEPLLSPPGEADPLAVCEGDWRIIDDGIESALRSNDPHSASDYVELMCYRSLLGRPLAMDDAGRRKVRGYLGRVRAEKFSHDTVLADRGYVLGRCLTMLEAMGERGFRERGDVWLVKANLREARENSPSSLHNAGLHHILERLGEREDVTDNDREKIGYWLSDFRGRRDRIPLSVMRQVYYKRRIGVEDRLSPAEEKEVVLELEAMRANRDPGIAEVLYMMGEMSGRAEWGAGSPPMPPLKRFR